MFKVGDVVKLVNVNVSNLPSDAEGKYAIIKSRNAIGIFTIDILDFHDGNVWFAVERSFSPLTPLEELL